MFENYRAFETDTIKKINTIVAYSNGGYTAESLWNYTEQEINIIEEIIATKLKNSSGS